MESQRQYGAWKLGPLLACVREALSCRRWSPWGPMAAGRHDAGRVGCCARSASPAAPRRAVRPGDQAQPHAAADPSRAPGPARRPAACPSPSRPATASQHRHAGVLQPTQRAGGQHLDAVGELEQRRRTAAGTPARAATASVARCTGPPSHGHGPTAGHERRYRLRGQHDDASPAKCAATADAGHDRPEPTAWPTRIGGGLGHAHRDHEAQRRRR